MATYIRALNEMWADDGEPSDKRQKSGHQQIIDNANQVIKTAVPFGNIGAFEIVGNSHCMNSTQSLDGRGRPQKSIRVGNSKINVRPWHLTYMLSNGPMPVDLQYSHRCHNELCINDTSWCVGNRRPKQKQKQVSICVSCDYQTIEHCHHFVRTSTCLSCSCCNRNSG